jgi:ethanolamine utilization protein EutN
MFLGKVVGTVWSSVKWPELEGLKLLLVKPYALSELQGGKRTAPDNEGVVCADTMDAGVGDDVVIAYGHAARVAISGALPDGAKPGFPIDAAVIAVVDRFAVSSE